MADEQTLRASTAIIPEADVGDDSKGWKASVPQSTIRSISPREQRMTDRRRRSLIRVTSRVTLAVVLICFGVYWGTSSPVIRLVVSTLGAWTLIGNAAFILWSGSTGDAFRSWFGQSNGKGGKT